MFGRRFVAALVVAGAGWGAGPAMAQEDLNRGKTPAQLFASDCADCHRNPRGLAKQDANSLAGFLRVHYTASRENAAAIAAYLVSLGPDPRAGSSRPATAPRTAPAGAKPSTSQDQTKPQNQTAQPAAKPSESAPAKPAAPAAESPPAAAPATPAPPPSSEPPAPATAPSAPAANPQ